MAETEVTAAEAATGDAAPVVETNETEQRARRMGWVPKEEFKGDPDRWRPADEFLSRGENIMPILQDNLRRLERKFGDVERENKELKETLGEITEFSRNAAKREYERARAELQAKITTAAQNADPEAANRAMREMETLERPKERAQAEQQKKPTIDPEIQEWIARETWFNASPMLNGAATEIFGELERSAPGMSTAERLAETKRRVQEMHPEKFGIAPARKTVRTVAEPSGGTPRKTGKTYDDLPAEAKKACDKFVRTIPGFKREDYVRDYDWSNA